MERIVRKEIEILKTEIQQLEIKVDDFSRYNRSVSEKERFEQIILLDEWQFKKDRLNVLEDCLNYYILTCEQL